MSEDHQHDWKLEGSDERTEWSQEWYSCLLCDKTLTETFSHEFQNGHVITVLEDSVIE